MLPFQFKKVFGKNNVSRSYDLPFDIKTRKFNYYVARRQGQPITLDYVRFIEEWARITHIVPPRMDLYIEKNMEIQHIFQNYASPDDILPYSIDEGFIDLTSSLKYCNRPITRYIEKGSKVLSTLEPFSIYKLS